MNSHRLLRATILGSVWLAAAGPAVAQRPTQAQVGAIRQACRGDYMQHCASVPTGGSAALACLKRNEAAVSAPCREALDAIGGGAPAAPQPRPAQRTPMAQGATVQPTADAAPAALAASPNAPAAESWPHEMTVNGARVTVYQPQVIAWPEHRTLRARVAIAVTPQGETRPTLGTLEIEAPTETDFATRSVVLSTPSLVSSNFPTLPTEQAARYDDRIKAALAAMGPKQVPLDTVLLSLQDQPNDQPGPGAGASALNNDPPPIYYSDRPASLVVFDGNPVLAPVAGGSATVAVNTNWDVFHDANGRWYLLDDGAWLTAGDVKGPWSAAGNLPAAITGLPNDANFAQVRKSIPGRRLAPGEVPTIFVSTVPAEIIVTQGPPRFQPIPGTGLRVVANTQAQLFQDSAGGKFYVLISGRWFSAPALTGPWSFATADLPADFARIPAGGAQSAVRVSVPGTPEAQEAVVQAGIPRQATLRRGAAKLDVTYAGPPEFKPIAGTDMAYATNTSFDVIRIGGKYYACWQGAWFVADAPNGPWALADSIPPAIRTIPPSNPLYHDTYVTVQAATPETVTYAYTAGYMMGFVTAGVLAYGTGYYYPPVVVPGPVPVYYPYAYSYAGSVAYNPATGTWTRGGTVYGPYRTATGGAAYNPATGAWARGGEIYGPNGGAGAWSAYNPTTGTYSHGSGSWGPNGGTMNAGFYNPRYGVAGSTHQNANAYSRWGSSTISGPNATVNTASASNARGSAGGFHSSTGAAGAGYRGAGGNQGGIARGPGGNVYAGADGNVYRRTSDGWSKWNDGSWSPVQKPSGSSAGTRTANASGNFGSSAARGTGQEGQFGQLNRDWQARSLGAQRQQQYGGWRNGGSGEAAFGNRFGGGSGGEFGSRFGGEGAGGGFHGGGGFGHFRR